ncbi:MAG: phosphoribosylformylglycinamidine synthase subunit PurQ [Bacteroidia bacterium]|nr:phosphoribosylformylglycinamidine synthase subunit PurQ [Bacteroidia bacterium]MCZ2277427.1 phosphoribosylformylglycinamidine synthase subunit PurQ [Bacteroidia bacterium]
MKFGVVVFPGSNCDRDMIYALETILKQKTEVLWHKEHHLKNCDIIILPGGFSYGDYLRSGAIARFSPIMNEVIEFAEKGGIIVGICNGFQVLCESHLLPGALLANYTNQFVCKNVYIRTETDESLITSKLKIGQVLKIPVAHGEGRYFTDAATLATLVDQNRILFRYCDENGNLNDAANPNGSLNHIAGICNPGRNVFGMMPHPERAADSLLGNTDGLHLFNSMIQFATA